LRITDIRTATVGWNGWRFPIVRLDTNQGLSGYGEVRDGASKSFALMLKNRLLGENPCPRRCTTSSVTAPNVTVSPCSSSWPGGTGRAAASAASKWRL